MMQSVEQNMIILMLATLLLAYDGVFTPFVLRNLALILPISFVGAAAGLWLFKRIPDRLYSRVLIGLMLVSGCALLLRTLLSGGS